MKALSFKRVSACAAASLALLAICSFAVHPFGRVKQSESTAVSFTDLNAPPTVAAVLEPSCMDCHSNRTVWPWYSYVAPMSWLVEKDVHRGRDRMNLSLWHRYTFREREKLFADIASAVKNREMPLPQYVLAHRQAKLSDADTDLLYGWARIERRKLKALDHR